MGSSGATPKSGEENKAKKKNQKSRTRTKKSDRNVELLLPRQVYQTPTKTPNKKTF